jgi:hypothetical protein
MIKLKRMQAIKEVYTVETIMRVLIFSRFPLHP